MIKLLAKIDVTKVRKEHLFATQKGAKYLDVAFHESPNEFSDGFITQSIPKELRDKGEKGPIIGNWKHPNKAKATQAPEKRGAAPQAQNKPTTQGVEPDDVPF